MREMKQHFQISRKPAANLSIYSKGLRSLCVSTVCFLTVVLSSISIQVSRTSNVRGAPSEFLTAFLHLTPRLKIEITLPSICIGLIATIMLALCEPCTHPHLSVPWLLSTGKGLIFHQGPTILSLAKGLLIFQSPNGPNIPAVSFVVVSLILYAEELYLWCKMLVRFRYCWRESNIGGTQGGCKARTRHSIQALYLRCSRRSR